MEGKPLYNFYESFLLPQFGIKDSAVNWAKSENLGPDEIAHYFSIGQEKFVLIFEDAGGLGSSEEYIKETIDLKEGNFEYVNPVSLSDYSPSYPIKFPTPYQYCENITGMFTLIKL